MHVINSMGKNFQVERVVHPQKRWGEGEERGGERMGELTCLNIDVGECESTDSRR